MHTGKRILIVDDSTTMTAIIFRILKDAKYTDIDCLHDGGSALAALRQKEYDLVITDWKMQPITGRADKAHQSGHAAFEGSHNPYHRITRQG
jgi:DNA-binding response OmpR family regulator